MGMKDDIRVDGLAIGDAYHERLPSVWVDGDKYPCTVRARDIKEVL